MTLEDDAAPQARDAAPRAKGAGGTSGGLGEFFVGLAVSVVGTYLFLSRVTVHTSFFRMGSGVMGFGVTLIPMLIGFGALFFNGRSVVGWVLTVGGFGIIVVGLIANLDVYFQPTSLWNTIVMLGLLAAGLGLIARSLRPH